MKMYMGFFIMIGVIAGSALQAEVVITSPTGVEDESDVVLETAVDSIKELPADTVIIIGDTVSFVGGEVRNTAHGVTTAFQGASARETVSADMLQAVTREWSANGEIQMRSFVVSEPVAKELAAGRSAESAVLDVSDFFNNVDFPEGTAAEFWPEFNRLIVHHNPAGMLDVIDLLSVNHQQDADYRQIEIETKFIEVEQKTLNELGFNWDFSDTWNVDGDTTVDLVNQTLSGTLRSAADAFYGAGSSGTLTLTKDGWLPLELTIRALEQSEGADVLSAPSVTTTDGSTAEIWVGDQEVMPSEFAAGSQGTSVYVEYDGWDQKNIGVHLQVTPEVEENNLINLALRPEVVDLVAYDSYDITPANASMLIWSGADTAEMSIPGRYPIPRVPGMDTAWNIMRSTLFGEDVNDPDTWSNHPENNASYGADAADGYFDQSRRALHEEYGVAVPQTTGSLPVFRVRKIDTSLTVADGSTVGMGGLIYDKLETYKDKVPVLGSIPLIGRLFRSEGERSVKRNLMIFVKATQVDVNGRRSTDMAVR